MTRRSERVNDLLRAELSELVGQQLKDPRLQGLVTITQVIASPDLRHAKVYVSVMGSASEKSQGLQVLTAAAGYLRRELWRRLDIKRIPELSFLPDDSIERGSHLLQLLREVVTPEAPPQQGEP